MRHYLANTALENQHPLVHLDGWAQEFNLGDSMHNIYQGVGGDFAGSCVISMCTAAPLYFAEDGDINYMLDLSYVGFKEWASKQGKYVTCPGFTRETLNWPSAQNYPCLECKASDCKLVLLWLAEELVAFAVAMEGDQVAYHMSLAARGCQHVQGPHP